MSTTASHTAQTESVVPPLAPPSRSEIDRGVHILQNSTDLRGEIAFCSVNILEPPKYSGPRASDSGALFTVGCYHCRISSELKCYG